MVPPRRMPSEREREEREATARRSQLSVRVGTVGVFLLFLAGVGVVLAPSYALPLIGVMVVGIVLLLSAFLLLRGSLLKLPEDSTKNL
ncbi:MAG: hypothetical protein AABX97_09170 [Candidatus Thermoplasmatota archaeon]